MKDPVSTPDGHCYERDAITHWLRTHDTSPATGVQLPVKTLTPNHALRNAIEEWHEKHFKVLQRGWLSPDAFAAATLLGVGSFKEVHKGTLRMPGSPKAIDVAVMRVRDGDVAAEANVLLQLGKHPHLIRFFGTCTDGPDRLLVTEFAPVGALNVLIEKMDEDDEVLPFGHKRVILLQVASAMEAVASEGLIHRDLALRNVLVFHLDLSEVTTVNVKVSDFGLAVNAYTATHKYVQDGDPRPIPLY